MQLYIPNSSATYKIFVGDTAYSNVNYETSNTLCYTGRDDGLAQCIGTGRYIIFNYQSGGDAKFGEISAFDYKNLGQISDGDTVTTTGISITDGDKNRLHGSSDSSIDCTDGTVSSGTFTATINFKRSVQVSDVGIFTRDGSNNIQTIQIDTMAEGVTTPCGLLTMTNAM